MQGNSKIAVILNNAHAPDIKARAALILRTHAFSMEMRIQLMQEIQYFAILLL